MKTKTLQQQATFKASPQVIYDLLMDSKKHSAFTGSKAVMSSKIKGEFSVFDGYCHGYNIELVPGKKMVQAWHFAEDGWPEDHFSICTFILSKHPSGCQLKLTQRAIPAHKYEALKEGWKTYYWDAIKVFLEK